MFFYRDVVTEMVENSVIDLDPLTALLRDDISQTPSPSPPPFSPITPSVHEVCTVASYIAISCVVYKP